MARRSKTTSVVVGLGLLIVGGFVLPPRYAHGTSQPSVIRLALVNVPEDVLGRLLPDFENSGYRVQIVYTGVDPYTVARNGGADVVISHYGHEGVEPFVTAGLGLWPHAVFANQMVLLGPSTDPAQVGGLTDAVEAFRRIAQSRSNFLSNNSSGAKYLEEILWVGAGRPKKGEWYIDLHLEGQQAVQEAARRGAYVLWGLIPFLRLNRQSPLDLQPLVASDPLLQRLMVSVVVNPAEIPEVNVEGALALQSYLIAPATQAQIRAFRYPDFDQQAWWPAGRHNNPRD